MLEVRTGCRLHFGLMELAKDQALRFGGWGLMLDQPGWRLRFTTDNSAASVDASEQSTEVHVRIAEALALAPRRANLHVEPLAMLPLHSGLGAGTQLACGVAVGLQLIERLTQGDLSPPVSAHSTSQASWQEVGQAWPELLPSRLAELSGRGLRSAVGLVGFLTGGLVLDQGYVTSCPSRPVAAQTVHLPAAWRVVLIAPRVAKLVSGDRESQMLQEIGLRPNPHRDRMYELAQTAQDGLRRSGAFAPFMDLLEAYMILAAELFAGQQGGMYNGAEVARAVHCALASGLRGVGQSSWGPTVFGFAPEPLAAQRAAQALRVEGANWSVAVTKPSPGGAQWRWRP